MSDDDEAGYGKPPKRHQFKKGRSGNPNGRPKGKKNRYLTGSGDFHKMILRVVTAEINVSDGGAIVSMAIMEAAMKTLMAKAAKGDVHAFRTLEKLLTGSSEKLEQNKREGILAFKSYPKDWMHRYRKEFKPADPFSIPLPHPDHLEMDYETGDIFCNGPFDRHQLHDFLVGIEARATIQAELIMHALEGPLDVQEHELLRDLNAHYLEAIPDHDPLWKLFGPELIGRILDHRLYYAPEVRFWDLEHSRGEKTEFDQPVHWRYPGQAKRRMKVENAFRRFMREKLQDLMDEDWLERLSSGNLTVRDVEHDYMRYQYESGWFDLDDYEFTPYEKTILRDPDVLRAYMSWDDEFEWPQIAS